MIDFFKKKIEKNLNMVEEVDEVAKAEEEKQKPQEDRQKMLSWYQIFLKSLQTI